MVIVTACYSRNPLQPYDNPKSPPDGCPAYCFTDDPLWYEVGWSRPPRERNNLLIHPRMRGKAPKCAPHLMGISDDDVLWIDSSMRWTGVDLSGLFALVPVGGMGCFRHRFRECIYDEAEASLAPGFDRYRKEPIREQVEHYRSQGYPARAGLWENGLIVWRGMQKRIGARWLGEMLCWTSQDQLSLPYVLGLCSIQPTVLPGTAVKNDWFEYAGHNQSD